MQCREARKKLTEFVAGTLAREEEEAVRDHLSGCRSCAQLALAERLLISDIKRFRKAQPSRIMTVAQVRGRIAAQDHQYVNTSLGVRIMRGARETINRRPRLSLAAAAALVMLLTSFLVPVRTERAIGYEVAFAAPGSGLALDRENAETVLAALDLRGARVSIHYAGSGVEYKIAPLVDTVQVRKLTAVLDSLGGRKIRSGMTPSEPNGRTIWQLLLNRHQLGADSHPPGVSDARRLKIGIDDLDERFAGDFTLWIPTGDEQGDSVPGVLMDRQGETTNIWLLGANTSMAPDDCGWHQYLNNSVMHTETPDGEKATFDLTDIEDVRKLEKMGYNFTLMEFDTPGQIPIPGMGPKLNEIHPNPFRHSATIEFMVPEAYEVKVQVLDWRGREMGTLLDCITVAGIYHVVWDGRDEDGSRVEPGAYICRFTAGDYVETQELLLER